MSTLTTPRQSQRQTPRRPIRIGRPGTIGRVAILLVAAALTLGPVMWTLSTSLRTPSESFNLPPQFLPLNPDLTSYFEVFEQINMDEAAREQAHDAVAVGTDWRQIAELIEEAERLDRFELVSFTVEEESLE